MTTLPTQTALNSLAMREDAIYEQLARYLNINWPQVIYHFDQSGMWTSSHKARNLYGKLNRRAWPDLLIAAPRTIKYDKKDPHKDIHFHGLFLEIKREGTRLYRRDGSYASSHIAEQDAQLERLRGLGYVAQFGVGYDQCVEYIESYLDPYGINIKEEGVMF